MIADLKTTQLRHFVWVAELKGFHAAAEKAHRTQPAISLSVRDLESKLGQSLFEKRNSKSARAELTPFGEYFLPKAKELIEHHDRVAADMQLLAKHRSGHLRLASVPSIASRVLPDLLQRFIADHNSLHISFYDDNSDAVLQMVENQQVDFAISHLVDQERHSDKRFIPIWRDQIGVVCPREHPLAQAKSLEWQALEPYKMIANGTSRLLRDSAAEVLVEHSQFYISNMISLIAMLQAGLGITTLPWYAFPQDSTKLVFVPLKQPHIERSIGIVMLNNKSLTPPAQALVDFILQDSDASEASR
ncbi:MAG: LysR family transcriptional regulator [Pseudomonadales bacterium]